VSLPSEQWLPIPGAEGRYEASTLGRIRSLPRPRVRGGILKPAADRKGYLFVTMQLDGDDKRKPYRVHKLIATTFHGPRPADKTLCRHRNDNRLDNRPENLAWGNMSENTIDTTENGINFLANRDACGNGHPYVDGSYRIAVYRSPFTVRPWRYCRVCDQVRNRKRRAEAHASLRATTGRPE